VHRHGQWNKIASPIGTRLPITPRFKVNGTARYTVPVGDAKAYAQLLVAHQSSATSEIRAEEATLLGRLKPYTTADFSLGFDWSKYSLEVFVQNVWTSVPSSPASRIAACVRSACMS